MDVSKNNSENGGTDESVIIWSLCLQSRQGRKVVSVKASSTTKDLYERASTEFGGTVIESIKGGFPPKRIDADESTLLSSLLSNQERLQVEFAPGSTVSKSNGVKEQTSNKTEKRKNSQEQSSNPNNGRKSNRAASKAATESMPALIKAQEEYLKSQQQSNKSKKRTRPTSSNVIESPRKQPSKAKSVKISASAGAGRRLADGATVSNPSLSAASAAGRRAAKATSRSTSDGSTGDLSEALLGALRDRGQMGVVLRKGMKNAVLSSYETTRAYSRLAAIQVKSFQMTTFMGNQHSDAVSGGNSSHLKVVYHGSVDKVKVEEIVDCIPLDVLQAVIEGIYASDREALRPENLARLSPRVLWSCVHHFSTETNIPDMFRCLIPNLDWSFLRRRAEQLSEKALENKRQAEEKERQKNGENAESLNLAQASDAIAAVEHAMEHLHDYQAEEKKARSAQAALARLQRQQQRDNNDLSCWRLTTPCEPDRDELRECIQCSVPEGSSASSIARWITQLMKDCNIHNWRELANVSNASTIAARLGVSEENVQAWIDHAQSESIGEIIVEVCDGNVQAVENLTIQARSGTPKDLAAWRSIPEILLEQLREPRCESASNSPVGDDDLQPTFFPWMEIETISEWCNRSQTLLEEMDWLNWYATPVA
ncbi:hypothetical protein IV203_035381 [Nitzschia inconspicua]|uniref:ubiquitinyl hydrolase 1 n=1 Tax=Nitzschia inconspicua TaxID=303405 RepID=A0A9K3PUL9_9STRA|nr:hypothetical protein IV203_035381 [Nitzschia inconspicua]